MTLLASIWEGVRLLSKRFTVACLCQLWLPENSAIPKWCQRVCISAKTADTIFEMWNIPPSTYRLSPCFVLFDVAFQKVVRPNSFISVWVLVLYTQAKCNNGGGTRPEIFGVQVLRWIKDCVNSSLTRQFGNEDETVLQLLFLEGEQHLCEHWFGSIRIFKDLT